MKKNILTIGLLVSLLAVGALTNNARKEENALEVRDVLVEDFGNEASGRLVRREANEVASNKLSNVKAQISSVTEANTRHIRFVAALDSYLYEEVSFTITASNGEETKTLVNNEVVTTAYTHVEANEATLSASEAFGEGYTYLVAYTINNVPESAWGFSFSATVNARATGYDESVSQSATRVISDMIAIEDEMTQMEEKGPNGAIANLVYNRNVDAAYTAVKTFEKDKVIKLDTTSDVEWVVSYGAKTTDAAVLQLGNIKAADYGYTSNLSLSESTITADTDTTSDNYKISEALGHAGNSSVIVSTVYTLDYISDITDIHLYWSANEAGGWIKMLYQLEGTDTWTPIYRDDNEGEGVAAGTGLPGVGTGERGTFNNYGYSNYLKSWRAADLRNQKARIAFTYEIYNPNNAYYYLTLGGIKINTVNSAINLANTIGTSETETLNGNLKRQLQVAMYGMTEDQRTTLEATTITTIEAATSTNYYNYLSNLATNNGL